MTSQSERPSDELQFEPGASLDERFGRVREWLGRRHADGTFSGTVLIARGGQVRFEQSLGFADVQARVPLSGQSSYALASVTKPFTALAILLLAERGALTTEDRLERFIPELPLYGEITIRQLLHHISGVPDYIELADEYWDADVALTTADMIGMLRQHRPPLYFRPGAQFEYSNTGYVLLGEIVARASGLSYPDFMTNEIFRPLGMNDSAAFNISSKTCPLRTRVYGFRRNFGRNMLCDLNFLDGVFGDGGVYASAHDLVRWDAALRDGALIPHERYGQAYVPGKLNSGKDTSYGFGWEIESPDAVEHFGEWEGFSAFVRRDVSQHTLLVVLCNLGPGNLGAAIGSELSEFVDRIEWSAAGG